MKNIKTLILLLCLLCLASSCRKEETVSVIGSWELVSVQDVPVSEGLSVWLDFSSDGFSLYQRAEENVCYQKFTGTWTLTGKVLSGKYSDGSLWASDYTVAVSGSELTLTSSGTPQETMRYRKASLPAGIGQ